MRKKNVLCIAVISASPVRSTAELFGGDNDPFVAPGRGDVLRSLSANAAHQLAETLPDAAARAYLIVIGRNPAAASEALHRAPQRRLNMDGLFAFPGIEFMLSMDSEKLNLG